MPTTTSLTTTGRLVTPMVVAEALGTLGERFTGVALPVFAVREAGATVAQSALLFTLTTLPGLLAMVLGRPFDTSRRLRAFCAGADLGRCALLAAVVTVAAVVRPPGWPWLLVLAAALGSCGVVFDVGLQAYLPRVVPAAGLASVNTWFARVRALADVLGPPVVGAVLTVAAPTAALALVAAVFALSGILLLTLPGSRGTAEEPPTPGGPGGGTPTGYLAGLRQLAADRPVRASLIVMMLLNLGGGMVGALFVAHVTEVLRVPSAVLGALMAAGGVSALVGSLFVRRLLAAWGPARAVAVCLPVAAVSLWGVPAAGVLPAVPALLVFQLMFSPCALVIGVAAATLRQTRTPPALQARVYAVVYTGIIAILPVAGLASAAVASRWGSTTAVVTGTTVALCALPFLAGLRERTVAPRPDEAGTPA
jgi:MFS family permease